MKKYAFNLSKKTLDNFQEKFPERYRARIIRMALVDPNLTKNFSVEKQENMVVHNFWLSDTTINRIDNINKTLNSQELNRSNVMNGVLNFIVQNYPENIIDPNDYVFRPFHVKEGTKRELDSLLPSNEKNEIVEAFILNEYTPNPNIDELKKSPEKTEQITFTLDNEAYKRLDDLKDSIGVKGISRVKLMRDVLEQLIRKHKELGENEVKNKVIQYIEEYKSIADPQEVRETLEKYLTDLD